MKSKYYRIFNNITHMLQSCFGFIYFDVIFWRGYLSEEDSRIQIESVQQSISPTQHIGSNAEDGDATPFGREG